MEIEFEPSEYYQSLAEKVIEKMSELQSIREHRPRIAYITSTQEKKTDRGNHNVCAECEMVKEKLKLFMPFDFIITVYLPNVEEFNEAQNAILMWHELQHVGVEETEKGMKYWVRAHDFEDFNSIVSRFGNWWNAAGANPESILD